MFNKRRKEAEKQARIEARAAVENGVEASLAAAEKIENPVEKLLKLEEISRNIKNAVQEEINVAQKEASLKERSILLGGGLGGAALGIGALALAAAAVAPPVAFGMWCAAGPATAGALFGGTLRGKTTKKKLQAEAESHFQKMDGFSKRVTEMKKTLINDQADEIAVSPLYEEVLKQMPDLSGVFSGAAAKKIAQLQGDLAAANKAAPQKQRPVPQLKSYDKFKNPLNPK